MSNKHLKDNPKARKVFRILGLTLTLIGGLCLLIGLVDFFSNSFPSIFWINFLGMFILFPGLVCLGFGYQGAVARYQAGEIAPIAKDATNYMLDGTREELVKTINQVTNNKKKIYCPYCQEDLEVDSNFCNHCGHKLVITCSNCNTDNDSDSRYCKRCGNKLEV